MSGGLSYHTYHRYLSFMGLGFERMAMGGRMRPRQPGIRNERRREARPQGIDIGNR